MSCARECIYNFFQNVKNNPVQAAKAGAITTTIATNVVLLSLYYEGMLFENMNEYAAQAAMAAIGLGGTLVGGVGGALSQFLYGHFCGNDNQDDLERAAITPRMR